ncbi:septum formation protein Maf [Clostridia bacterium]|nr:septum formation protein Maf [Clostridia bacterium]
MQNHRLILASSSPRRLELIRAMGLQVEQVTSNADEIAEGEPIQLAMENARLKAEAIRAAAPDAYILGADTIVVLNGTVYGKPRDEDDAARILRILQGRSHEVITGVCLVHGQSVETAYDRTSVRFSPMTEREIRAYIATGDPMDKAGAYGIQGMMRMYVESVQGSYDNVMGLPTALVRRMLVGAGLEWV